MRKLHTLRAGDEGFDLLGLGTRAGFRAGEGGMTLLAYGTRNANDVCNDPGSNKIYLRGLGLIARLDDLDYADGEPG